eukprot:16445555-Heterocapsa_arctica.AAC.1
MQLQTPGRANPVYTEWAPSWARGARSPPSEQTGAVSMETRAASGSVCVLPFACQSATRVHMALCEDEVLRRFGGMQTFQLGTKVASHARAVPQPRSSTATQCMTCVENIH